MLTPNPSIDAADPAIDAADEVILVPFRGCGLGPSVRWPRERRLHGVRAEANR